MKTCIIACETIRKELELACKREACEYPVLWLEPGLHNVPEKLRRSVQEMIDKCGEYDRILLAMGYCGNAVCGIRSDKAVIIIPKVDDCISLLLGSAKRRQELVRGCGTYFLTEGWLAGEKNIYAEYRHSVERYGQNRAKRLVRTMLKNYERLGVLDTGACPLENLLPRTEKIAEELELRHEVIKADDSYLRLLLSGPWDDTHFLLLRPGRELEFKDLLSYY